MFWYICNISIQEHFEFYFVSRHGYYWRNFKCNIWGINLQIFWFFENLENENKILQLLDFCVSLVSLLFHTVLHVVTIRDLMWKQYH